MCLAEFLENLDKCNDVNFQEVADKIEKHLGQKVKIAYRVGISPENYLQIVLESMYNQGYPEEYLSDIKKALYG